MKRLLALAVMLVLGTALVLPEVRAQTNIKGTIDYIDPTTKKKGEVTGQIVEEGPGGVKVKEGAQIKQIPALAITRITYVSPNVDALTFREGFTKELRALDKRSSAERKQGLEDALESFHGLVTKLRDAPAASRYIQYKIAIVKLELAKTEPENKGAMKTAMDALTEFKDKHSTGWQIVPVLTTLARLQEEQGNINEARRAYESLTVIPDAPSELKREGEMQVAQMFVRARRYAEAESKLNALYLVMPPDDPQRGLLQVYLAGSQLAQNKVDGVEEKLKSAIASSSEAARLRPTAHNLLGDYYRAKKDDENALWHYLMVDVLYSQDREEHAKALYYLSKLFESVQGNRFRAQQCLERLTDKSFAGNEYHSKALTEKRGMK